MTAFTRAAESLFTMLAARKTKDLSAKLPPGQRLYAIGDIHGRMDCLTDLLEKIALHRRSYKGHVTIVFLGDYIDRGPSSREVLSLLSDKNLAEALLADEIIFLRGNHEDVLLHFLEDPTIGPEWATFGGLDTLASYKALSHLPSSSSEWAAVSKSLSNAIPLEHQEFLRATTFSFSKGGYFFAHAGLQPGIALEHQRPRDLMWIRDTFTHDRRNHGAVVVHGHCPANAPQSRHNRIGIDTGAYASGRLTSLALEENRIEFLFSDS